jgi:hypothetical protein
MSSDFILMKFWEARRAASVRETGVQLRRLIWRYRWANAPPEQRKFLRKSQL